MTGARRRRVWPLAALAVAAAAGGYYAWRPRPPEPPAVELAGVEPDVAQAVTAAHDRVRADPASNEAWEELGLVLFAHSFYKESRPCFEEAERRSPTDPRWPYYLGLSHLPADPEQALPCLDRAVERSGGEVAPRIRRAEVLLGLERWDEAREAFEDARRRQPGHPRVALGLGQLAARAGEWERAEALLTPVADDPTCRMTARSLLAEAAARRGDAAAGRRHQAALEDLPKDEMWSDPYLETMLKRVVGTSARLRRAATLMNRRAYTEAEAVLNDLLRAHPDHALGYLNLGRVYLGAGDPGRAEAALARAVELDPRAPVAQFLLGSARLQRGNAAGAEVAFRAAVASQPDYAPAHYYLGQCRQRQGDPRGAIHAYREAVRYRPNLADAHLALGAALVEAGDAAAARPHLEDALRLRPDDRQATRLLQQLGGR